MQSVGTPILRAPAPGRLVVQLNVIGTGAGILTRERREQFALTIT